jgi:hypothetical protein
MATLLVDSRPYDLFVETVFSRFPSGRVPSKVRGHGILLTYLDRKERVGSLPRPNIDQLAIVILSLQGVCRKKWLGRLYQRAKE